jgi:hypothetical protein
MGLLQRYLLWFEGEPVWLILLVSVLLVTGAVVIVEKLFKVSLWLMIVSFVAMLVILLGSWFLFR